MTIIRLLLLVLVSQLRGCFAPLCDAVRGYETNVIHTRTGEQVMHDAALTNDGDLIVAAGIGYHPPGEYHQTAVRVSGTYGPSEAATFKLADYFGSGVIASEKSWWYSVAGGRDKDQSGVFFVTPEVTFVEVGPLFHGDWLPFDEPEPHGLLIGDDPGGSLAMEITRAGVRREWVLPRSNIVADSLRGAERLTDGAIALVSIGKTGLFLQILDAEKEPPLIALREHISPVRVKTALSDEGMLAVVFESTLGELEAAVFDPRNPGELTWQLLTTKEEPGRFPRVVFHDGKFIAAWLAPRTDELRARTFTAKRPGPAATIAPLLRRGGRIPSISIIPDGEEIVFVWQEDEVTSRRVPADFAGLWFTERLCELFGGSPIAAR